MRKIISRSAKWPKIKLMDLLPESPAVTEWSKRKQSTPTLSKKTSKNSSPKHNNSKKKSPTSTTASQNKCSKCDKYKTSNEKNSTKSKFITKINKPTSKKNLTNKTKSAINCKLKLSHCLNNKITVWAKWVNWTRKGFKSMRGLMSWIRI